MSGVKFVSELAPSGYGRAGQGYLHALRLAGAELTWTPMVPSRDWGMYLAPSRVDSVTGPDSELRGRRIPYDVVMVNLTSGYFPKWRLLETGKKLIGVTVWETERLPGGWLEELACLDGLIVPSRWNVRVFRKGGVTCPIHPAPHVYVDTAAPTPEWRVPYVPPSDFVFYSIGEWTERKGLHLTVEAFCRAFTRDDPVTLVVKSRPLDERRRRHGRWWWHLGRHLGTTARAMDRTRHAHRRPPKIVLLTERLSDGQLNALHARGDCYVSLTRAEGWGLGAYEAAFQGKPVIMTPRGGQADFLPERLSYHVDFRLVRAGKLGSYEQSYEGHDWADPDIDHGARLMREVFENQAAARERGRELQAYVRERFDVRRIGGEMMEFARSLA